MAGDANALSLAMVLEGWDGYQLSLVRAVAPRSREQLIWRPAPHLRTAGELARHIAAGRVDWFSRTFGLEVIKPAARVSAWRRKDPIEEDPAELVCGLEASWQMIEEALRLWTVADLALAFPLSYQGQNYALPRQWILWRVMAHDLHHGGELAVTLGLQGIELHELGDEGGHLTPPPLAEPS
ncbi:MAG TPA: DinB family protein [Ktedonobacterales bacterium]|nr:DinB family protein [Ktedonobacterales bacterium]